MPIKISCPDCPTKLNVKDELAGRSVKCPKCSSIVKVPSGQPAPSTARAAAETKKIPAGGKASTVSAKKKDLDEIVSEDELPKKKKRLLDEDEEEAPRKKKPSRDDDEDEDETPRKKKPSRYEDDEEAPRKKKASRYEDDEEEEAPRKKKSSRQVEELEEDRPSKKRRRDDEDDDLGDLEVPEFEVPEKYQAQIEDELSKGEKMIWCGQPSRRVVMIRTIFRFCIGGFIFFCVAGGLIIAGLVNGVTNQGAGMLLMGLIFMLPAISLMLTPFYKLWQAGRTCYVLTNRRCIVWACNWYGGVDMDNYNPVQLVNMFRRDMWILGKGAGDLVFRTRTVITQSYNRNTGFNTSVTTYYYGFLSVENVRDVERLVRETLTDRVVDRYM